MYVNTIAKILNDSENKVFFSKLSIEYYLIEFIYNRIL